MNWRNWNIRMFAINAVVFATLTEGLRSPLLPIGIAIAFGVFVLWLYAVFSDSGTVRCPNCGSELHVGIAMKHKLTFAEADCDFRTLFVGWRIVALSFALVNGVVWGAALIAVVLNSDLLLKIAIIATVFNLNHLFFLAHKETSTCPKCGHGLHLMIGLIPRWSAGEAERELR